MIRSLFFVSLISVLFGFQDNVLAQSENDAYVLRDGLLELSHVLYPYDFDSVKNSRQCAKGVSDLKLGYRSKVIIESIDSDMSVVVLATNSDGPEYAKQGIEYCIPTTELKHSFNRKDSPLRWGILTVPYKLRFKPYFASIDLTPGGSVGGYIGAGFRVTDDLAAAFFGFGSFTTVAINNLEDNAPQTKLGVSLGGGAVLTLPGNFQAGLVVGTDLFNGAGSWAYHYLPWLALSVGYGFAAPAKESAKDALATK